MFKYCLKCVVIGFLVSLALNAQASEQDYTDAFCKTVGGNTKYTFLDRTRPDCIDDKYAYETDWANGPKTYEGVGQSLHYADQANLKPGLVLILKQPSDIRFAHKAANLNVCPKITVWTIDENFTINRIYVD